MAAISSCTRVLRQAAVNTPRAEAKAVVLGFPYLDTLKLLQHPHLGPGAHFIPDGDVRKLEAIAQSEPILAVYIEVPSNPLLKTINLQELRSVANTHGFPIIADDSIGNFCNIDVLSGRDSADVLVSSLTKTFSGRGNVMGGSMIVNPKSQWYQEHFYHATACHQDLLFMDDAQTLLNNAASLEARNARTSSSAEQLADYLSQHPAVAAVHFPKYNNPQEYRAIARTQNGWGALMSVILKDETKAATVYDVLKMPKGPGFGTNFSLVCPYTMLAHYQELDFVRQHGVDPNLLRVWVGLEPVEEIIAAWEAAFDAVEAPISVQQA
jgi:cystathionine gamma-synthase